MYIIHAIHHVCFYTALRIDPSISIPTRRKLVNPQRWIKTYVTYCLYIATLIFGTHTLSK